MFELHQVEEFLLQMCNGVCLNRINLQCSEQETVPPDFLHWLIRAMKI